MKVTLVCIVAMILTTGLHQVVESDQSTEGIVGRNRYSWTNGRAWKVLDTQSRITLLVGIEQGAFLMLRQSWDNSSQDSERQLLGRSIGQLVVRGFLFSDLVEQIDDFYRDSANIRIPVVDAYMYSLRKVKGAKRAELEAYTAELRAKYNQ